MNDNAERQKHMNTKTADLARRYLIFLAGLFVASMGVAFSAIAGLGTSPVASVPYAVSQVSPLLSLGGWLNVLSVIQIIAQIIVLKGKCNYAEIAIQTALAFVYGYLTNFSCWLIRGIQVNGYLMQLLYMLLGCVILAVGLWIQYKGGVALLPAEALNRAISKATGRKYENIKIFFDVFYVTVAAVITLVFLGEMKGVREGSIVAALGVGMIIKALNRLCNRIKKCD